MPDCWHLNRRQIFLWAGFPERQDLIRFIVRSFEEDAAEMSRLPNENQKQPDWLLNERAKVEEPHLINDDRVCAQKLM